MTNSITVETQSNDNGFDSKLWIDFNQDGNFDADESFDANQSGNTFTFNVIVPNDAISGITKLRLVYQFIFGNTQIVACNSMAFFRLGEVEDYCVNIIEPVSTEELEEEGVSFYPNPVSDVLNLTNHMQHPYSIKVVNVLGKVLNNQVISGYSKTQINVANLPVGLYILEYTGTNNLLYRKKFIKQ